MKKTRTPKSKSSKSRSKSTGRDPAVPGASQPGAMKALLPGHLRRQLKGN